MAPNALGPWYMKVYYTSAEGTKEHVQTISVVGTGAWSWGGTNNLLNSIGSPVGLAAGAAAYTVTLRAILSDTDFVSAVDFLYQATPTDPIVLADTVIVDAAGTRVGGADKQRIEAILTYKTPTRGGLKIYVMDQYLDPDQKFTQGLMETTAYQSLGDFILSSDNFICGRNGEYPVEFIHLTTKENDHQRRKFLNP